MKPLFAVLSIAIIMASCSKQAVVLPQNAASQLFYKDGNIEVSAMKAVQTNATTVQVDFSTAYVNNVAKIDVMSGNTANLLCTIGEIDLPGNITKSASFSVTDSNLKGQTMYYMLRYTLNSGDWGYTPVVSVTLK
jgi:hypothetical protein